MEFETQPDYTVEDYAAFWYGFRDKRAGVPGQQKLSRKEMRRCGWLFLAVGVFMILMWWPDPLNLQLPIWMFWPGPFFLVAGALLVIQWPSKSEPVQPRWARKFWKKWAAQDPGLRWRYRFTPEGVELHNCGSDHRYDYDRLQQVWQDGEHIYFTLDRHWHILNKSQFTKGDSAQFAAFLTEQTGRPVRWVNGAPEESGVME